MAGLAKGLALTHIDLPPREQTPYISTARDSIALRYVISVLRRVELVNEFGGTFNSVNARRVKQDSDSAPKKEPSEICQAFARNLRAAREEAGLSRARLAEAADVSERHIWLIETTALNVKLETVAALAKHLGKTPLELLRSSSPRRKSVPVSDIEN